MEARREDGSLDVPKLLRHPEWQAISAVLERLGHEPGELLPRLAHYIALVLDWNRRVSNLVSRGDESRLVDRHLIESLEPAQWLSESGARTWIDLGSGAGFPALPIAMCGIGAKWLCVESRRPRTLFLRNSIDKLALSESISVEHARLELLIEQGDGLPAMFDGFTSRATLRMAPTLELAARIVRKGGFAYLWKGSRRDEELAADEVWSADWNPAGVLPLSTANVAVCRFIRK